MKTYAIGDLQGCADETEALLQCIAADAAGAHAIIFVGDLVNRGPDSLATLRRVAALCKGSGGRIEALLGNHDLHLLAVACGAQKASKSDTFEAILVAPERDALIDWLRHRPLARLAGAHLLVHAGVLPQWSAAQTVALAAEVEAVLRGPDWSDFLSQMYGNVPDRWDDTLTGIARLRCIVNALTRMRYCLPGGVMAFGQPENGAAPADAGLLPWFELPGRASSDVTVVFGHWSQLGLLMRENVIGLDSGCVWGGKLSAVCLEQRSLLQVDCPQYKQHAGKQQSSKQPSGKQQSGKQP